MSVMCSCRRRCLTIRRQSRSTQIPVTATSRSLHMPQLHTRTSAQASRNLSTRHRARPVSIRSISRAHRCKNSAAIWARLARIRTSWSRCMPCSRATRGAQLRLADSAAIDPAASENGKRTSRVLRPRLLARLPCQAHLSHRVHSRQCACVGLIHVALLYACASLSCLRLSTAFDCGAGDWRGHGTTACGASQ